MRTLTLSTQWDYSRLSTNMTTQNVKIPLSILILNCSLFGLLCLKFKLFALNPKCAHLFFLFASGIWVNSTKVMSSLNIRPKGNKSMVMTEVTFLKCLDVWIKGSVNICESLVQQVIMRSVTTHISRFTEVCFQYFPLGLHIILVQKVSGASVKCSLSTLLFIFPPKEHKDRLHIRKPLNGK